MLFRSPAGVQPRREIRLLELRRRRQDRVSFLHYAAFVRREQEEETYRMPISETVLEQIKSGRKKVVYMENTYRLGYECMQMIEAYGKKKKMESIFLQPLKLDREILEAGSLDALLAR